MDDYLAAEPLLIARLRERLDPGIRVLGAAQLAALSAQQQISPAVHVIYYGYMVLEARGDGAARVGQIWYVVTAVRNVREVITGAAARAEAGPILAQILAALPGWKPSAGHGALKLAVTPPPAWSEGFGYFPLGFTTEVVVGPV